MESNYQPTEKEKRDFGIHKRYAVSPFITPEKKKVEGWRLVLKEGKVETTLPNMNDKPYALLVSFKNKMILERPDLKNKLLIKPKI